MDDASSSPTESSKEKTTPPVKMSREFLEKWDSTVEPEEKIAFGLQSMRQTISQEGSPRFREFWEIRRLLLPLFRGSLNSTARAHLWSEYVEITEETRKLRDVLEEQSSFAIEQIDLAIDALGIEIEKMQESIERAPLVDMDSLPEVFQEKGSLYQEAYQNLYVLMSLATRLQALRGEVVRTEMRIRTKTKIFHRLSALGDLVFPKRKEWMEKVSEAFENDVQAFQKNHFVEKDVVGAPYFVLREQIKALQQFGKQISLTSPSFRKTRLQLSECWDAVREVEKEHKKVQQEKRQAASEAFQEIQSTIDALQSRQETLSFEELDKEISPIFHTISQAKLDRDDAKTLRSRLDALKEPHLLQIEAARKEREALERAKKEAAAAKLQAFCEEIEKTIEMVASSSLEESEEKIQQIVAQKDQFSLSRIEKQKVDRLLHRCKDALAEKKEEALLQLPASDRRVLENLRSLLEEKKERKAASKETIEQYRKLLGSSSLDFEKAMLYREQIELEKELLEKIDGAIQEIEDKLSQIELS